MRRSLLIILVVVLALACRGEQDAAEATGTTGTSDTAVTMTDAVLDPATVKLAIEEPIVVSITDSGINVQGEPIPGATEFQVTNNGSQVYSLVIEGPGARGATDAPLQPLETRTVTMDVQAGSYRLYVPEAQDRLSTQVDVTAPQEPATTNT